MRYGADKIFRAGDSVTEEDIDTILAGAKNLTAERSQKLESKEKRDLLDFSNAEVNFQEFEGVDYKSMAQQGDREFIEMMQDSMGKRERTSTVSYNERDAYRGAGASSSKPPTEPGQPKRPKVPDMKDYQLFNVQRINELHEAEYQRELKRTKAASRLSEAGQEVPDEKPSPEEIAEKKELEELDAAGFKDWTRNDYSRFIKSAEKNGRDKLNDIAEDLLGTKTLEEVTTYSEAFWRLGPTHIGDWEKVSKKIEEGEKKIAEKSEMATLLTSKVKSAGDNPWDNLTLKYGNNRGKLFNEEEDRFLLCMTDKLGYGRWEELKREVRLRPEFRFDWLFKSRTPIELGRRVDLLIRVIRSARRPSPRSRPALPRPPRIAPTARARPRAGEQLEGEGLQKAKGRARRVTSPLCQHTRAACRLLSRERVCGVPRAALSRAEQRCRSGSAVAGGRHEQRAVPHLVHGDVRGGEAARLVGPAGLVQVRIGEGVGEDEAERVRILFRARTAIGAL